MDRLVDQGAAASERTNLRITQMKRYEAGASQPTLEVIRKLSQALRVSADALLFGRAQRGPDEDLRLQFEAISRFNDDEKKVGQERARRFTADA